MKHIFKYTWVLVLGLFASCDPEIEETSAPSVPANVNLANYVAIGNSLTAGYSDNGLYAEAVASSYPSIIAQQFQEVGGAKTFNQPPISANGTGYVKLSGFTPTGSPILTEVPADPNWTNTVSGKFQNLGIPGIRVAEVAVPNWPNPYLQRIIPQGQVKSYLDLVREADISFYTCWLGNNDVLGYATSGGAAGINGDPNRLGLGGITDVVQFQNLYNQLIGILKQKNAKGIVATIPNVTDIPYFTTIAWNAFPLTAEQATQLNAGLKANIETAVRNAVTKVAIETQIAPAVITMGATLQLVVPAVIREAVKRTSVIPSVINFVGNAQGFSPEQIAALTSAYSTAYAANQSRPSAAGTPFPQQLFDVITTEVNNAMNSTEVQGIIADLTEKYSTAYLANQDKPAAVAPYTQAQFDAITEEVKKQTASEAFKQGVQAQIAAYIANPNDPNFAAIKAEVDKQLNSAPVKAAIDAEVTKQITALKQGGFYPEVKAGNNPFIISDSRSPTGLRSAKNDDLICLTALAELTRLGALGQPPILGNQFVLTKTEQDPAVAAINSYNEYIRKLADDPNIALFDANKLFSDVVKNGYSQDGFRNTTAFITGGIFSLDGVHPTPRGYAIVANEMIKAMNNKFKTNIKQVNIGNYRTVVFPSN